MSSHRFVRARSPEQKEVRRDHLLRTARGLLADGLPLDELGLNELARQAGIAKGNVYRYFESREAVLLSLLETEVEQTWARFADGLRRSRRKTTSLDTLMELLARALAAEPLLCSLTAAVPAVLERNLGVETISAFKRRLLAFFHAAGASLSEVCPALAAEDYAALLYDVITTIVGLWPMSHPAPNAAQAIEPSDLRFFRRDFADELVRLARAIAASYARAARG